MVSANNVVEGLKGQAQNMVQTVALAIKGNKGQIPELWTQLATSNPGPEWVNIAERRLHKGDVPGAKAVLQVVLEGQTVSNAAHAHLLLIQAFLLSGQDSLIEALSVARRGYSQALAAQQHREVFALSAALAVALAKYARLGTHSQQQRQAAQLEAISLLQAALTMPEADSNPHLAQVQYTLAVLHAESGQAEAAVVTARQALASAAAQPASQLTPLCLALVSMLLSARQQPASALKALSAVGTHLFTTNPTSANGNGSTSSSSSSDSALPCMDALVARLRARLLTSAGDAEASASVLVGVRQRLSAAMDVAQAGGRGDEQALLREQLAQVWADMALAASAHGQHEDALHCVEAMQALRPWDPSTACTAGQVQEAAGQLQQAFASYTTAIALGPSHVPSLLRMGAWQRRHGGVEGLSAARDMLREALRYDPSHGPAWYQLGLVSRALGHREAAESQLLTAVRLAAAQPALPYSSLPLRLPVVV